MPLAIVIVNYCTPDLTLNAVRSAHSQIGSNDKIFVIDGASPDDSAQQLKIGLESIDKVEFVALGKNLGFSFANNAGIRMALKASPPPEYLLLLNPDTVARESAIDSLVAFMKANPQVGLAGSRLENADGTTQWAAKRFHSFFSELDDAVSFGPMSRLLQRWNISHTERDTPHPTDWVPGAALMIRREVFESIGLLDESYFLYFEEVDFCLRARRAGFSCWYVPQSRVIHFVGQSTGVTSARPGRRPRYWFESRARFWLQHYGLFHKLACDLAWVLGRASFHLRCLVQRKRNPFPPSLWRDFVRFNFGSRDAWKR